MTTQTRRVTEQPLNLVLRPELTRRGGVQERRPRAGLRARARARPRVPRRPDAREPRVPPRLPRTLAGRRAAQPRPRARRRDAATPAERDPRAVLPGCARDGDGQRAPSVHRGTVPEQRRQAVRRGARVAARGRERRRTRRSAFSCRAASCSSSGTGVTSETRARRLPRLDPLRGTTVYYAVAVYSEGSNGIVAFDAPWKNVCATLYHELQEVRTDPDVEDAIRAGHSPAAAHLLGWYSPNGGEIGDIPIAESRGDIQLAMKEVPLAAGGTAPVQLMWSNRVGGPEAPPDELTVVGAAAAQHRGAAARAERDGLVERRARRRARTSARRRSSRRSRTRPAIGPGSGAARNGPPGRIQPPSAPDVVTTIARRRLEPAGLEALRRGPRRCRRARRAPRPPAAASRARARSRRARARGARAAARRRRR